MSARESVILKAVLTYLDTRKDVLAWRNNTGAAEIDDRFIRFGEKGSGDVLGVQAPSGRAFAIETKSRAGRLSPDQTRWSEDFKRCGGLYIIARSVQDVVVGLGPPTVDVGVRTGKRVYHGAV